MSTLTQSFGKLRTAQQTPLHENDHIAVYRSHLLLFDYYIRHNLTTKAFTDLL